MDADQFVAKTPAPESLMVIDLRRLEGASVAIIPLENVEVFELSAAATFLGTIEESDRGDLIDRDHVILARSGAVE